MTFHVSLVWALGSLLAGVSAWCLLRRGGHGLIADIGLGLGGSLVASLILRVLGVAPEAGLFAMIVAAFVGAAGTLVVQRTMWAREHTGGPQPEPQNVRLMGRAA